MGLFRRAAKAVAKPVTPHFDRRVEFVVAPTFARKEEVGAVQGELNTLAAELREATTEMRRLLDDDLEAATETAALIGQSLGRLTDEVEELRRRVESLAAALEVQQRPPSS
jgi:HAMP domain-containing protein